MKHLEGEESSLVKERCVVCDEASALGADEIDALSQSLERGWRVVDGHHLKRRYRFPSFRESLEFANRVGDIAEVEGHHPTITIGWGFAEVVIFTHVLDGLSRNDFILASKISRAVRQTYKRHVYIETD